MSNRKKGSPHRTTFFIRKPYVPILTPSATLTNHSSPEFYSFLFFSCQTKNLTTTHHNVFQARGISKATKSEMQKTYHALTPFSP